ncbi:hypothetical protein AABB24_007010 [Solanum stoloniferum]|uniref:Cytochrome P450 n=1 Tax=Solanum stoloniferum TaxID=62892 RepID=A0ABD2UMH3_9SOLN
MMKISNLLLMNISSNTTFFIIISILLTIFISIIILKKWNSSVRNNKPLPPGPISWPIIGCFPQIILKNKHALTHRIHKIMDTEIACIRLGNYHVIPITSLELACDSIFFICMSGSLVSNGYLTPIFVPSGDQWMKMKKKSYFSCVVTNIFSMAS